MPCWVYWVWLIAIVSLGGSIAALFVGVTSHVRWNVETVSLSIILAFVGILATFVVISNYMQVKEVKDEFEIKTIAIKKDCDDKIDELKTKIKELLENNTFH
jgi:hypothetical protein